MGRASIFIDVTRCNGCYNCFLACRDEHCGNDYPGYSAAQPPHGQFWMQIKEIERGTYPRPKVSYIPVPCQHCAEAPCIDAATGGAVYRREDGIVVIDPEKGRGQKAIVNACPYRVVYWNAEKELPQKCTLCAHRLDEGEKQPRCVESCPTGALVFGDLDDADSDIARLAAAGDFRALHPEYGADPLIRYRGMPKRFVAGEVVLADKQHECARGIRVTLSGVRGQQQTFTDQFGDFEFDGLGRNQTYQVAIAADGYVTRQIEVSTARDVYLGEIVLAPK